MSDYDFGRAWSAVAWLFWILVGLLVIFGPLGVWKAWELIQALLRHVHWV